MTLGDSTSFTPAITLKLPQPLKLPTKGIKLVGGLITQLEASCINMIEADHLEQVHTTIHHIMVDAVTNSGQVLLVDLANCFSPQKISSIAFDKELHGQLILQQIGLARPFQIHQAVSIIKELVRQVEQASKPHLIVITDISSLFFDHNLAKEDPEFPVPQLEKLRQCIGILESLVVQGHTVVISNRSRRTKSVSIPQKYRNTSTLLNYSAKVHIRIDHGENYRRIRLISHPYLPENELIERDLSNMIKKRKPAEQRSLNEFFEQ